MGKSSASSNTRNETQQYDQKVTGGSGDNQVIIGNNGLYEGLDDNELELMGGFAETLQEYNDKQVSNIMNMAQNTTESFKQYLEEQDDVEKITQFLKPVMLAGVSLYAIGNLDKIKGIFK